MNDHVDFEYLENLTGGDVESFSMILSKIAEESKRQHFEINKAFEVKNWPDLKFHSHKLKSSMLYLNNTYMHGLLKQIEDAANYQQNLDQIEPWVKSFNENIFKLIEKVETKLAEMSNA